MDQVLQQGKKAFGAAIQNASRGVSFSGITVQEWRGQYSFTYDNHYGAIIGHTKAVETNNPYAYTGREFDTEELYYYRARYYDPTIQRFISEDPIGFASGDFNWYRYVLNSPVNLVDPWGLFSFSFDFYYGWGGGFSIGENPDGKLFVSLRTGYGLGGGFNIDPNGHSPNYKSNGCYGIGAGIYGGAYVDIGPLTMGYNGNAGASSGANTIPQSLYTNQGSGFQLNGEGFGFRGGVSVGGEFTLTW